MLIPQHRHPRQRRAVLLALPIASDDEGTVGIALAAHAHATGVRFQDARLEVRFDGPGVQGFFESFEGGKFLPEMQRWHGFLLKEEMRNLGYGGRVVGGDGVSW